MAIALEEISMAFRALSDDDSARDDGDIEPGGAALPEEPGTGIEGSEKDAESVDDLAEAEDEDNDKEEEPM